MIDNFCDPERKKENVKMSKLLDVLLNSHTRVPMSALLKCEQVLEKMDFQGKVSSGAKMIVSSREARSLGYEASFRKKMSGDH